MKFKKICAHCKQPFETNRTQKIYCDRPHYRPCPVCGVPVQMIDNDFSRPPRCCSSECTHKLRQSKFKPRKCILCGELFQPKSGVNLACDKIHYDKCEICGKEFIRTVDNFKEGLTTCSLECRQIKTRRKNLEKYGVEHPMQCKEVQAHHQAAMLQKYGHAFALQCPEFKQKQEATNLAKFDTIHACLADICKSKSPASPVSHINQQIYQKLTDTDIVAQLEFKLDRFAYDIIIPDMSILIEIDPTYTHNAIGNHWNRQGLDINYHRNKTIWANDHGYQCIHIWDWDDVNMIVNQLKPKIQIQGSELQSYRLTKEVTDKFLKENCIHGTCRGQLLSLGLIKDNEIYQIITFGKSKHNSNYPIEMKRACTKIGYEVINGYDMLTKLAAQEFGVESCIAYQDISKISDFEYEKLGMRMLTVNPPRKFWSKGKKFISNYLVQNPNTEYTETSLLQDGWLPVYDCGQAVYVTQ